ncbi:hypothetical protein STEG23_014086 [Scotinomys teguina]
MVGRRGVSSPSPPPTMNFTNMVTTLKPSQIVLPTGTKSSPCEVTKAMDVGLASVTKADWSGLSFLDSMYTVITTVNS